MPLSTETITITVGARDSKLSKVQVQEVFDELQQHLTHISHRLSEKAEQSVTSSSFSIPLALSDGQCSQGIENKSNATSYSSFSRIGEKCGLEKSIKFICTFMKTKGDLDLKTSLKGLDKTDFFTREIDHAQLQGHFRISVHSAKDLPDPLPEGLKIIAITKGQDPRDSLVFREGENLNTLASGAKIGISSQRREDHVRKLRKDLSFIDIRGSIEQRLAKLDHGEIDGLVVAEAALIRLARISHRFSEKDEQSIILSSFSKHLTLQEVLKNLISLRLSVSASLRYIKHYLIMSYATLLKKRKDAETLRRKEKYKINKKCGLGLTDRNRLLLEGSTTPLQGKLAIVACSDDIEMERLFQCLKPSYIQG